MLWSTQAGVRQRSELGGRAAEFGGRTRVFAGCVETEVACGGVDKRGGGSGEARIWRAERRFLVMGRIDDLGN